MKDENRTKDLRGEFLYFGAILPVSVFKLFGRLMRREVRRAIWVIFGPVALVKKDR